MIATGTARNEKKVNYEVGEYVLVSGTKLRKRGKLIQKYYDPYEIIKKIGATTYRLAINKKELGRTSPVFHERLLKKWYERGKIIIVHENVIISSLLLKNKTRDFKERNILKNRRLQLNNKSRNPKEENIRKGERLQKDLKVNTRIQK
jgi:hypothetical protein